MTVRVPRTQPRRPAALPRALLVAAGVATAGLSAACGGARPASAPGVSSAVAADAGAPSASGAVQGFVAAARVSDVRSMGLLFGTAAGPVAGRDPSADVEKRMRALACYLTHDNARVVDDMPAVAAGNRRLVTVSFRQREITRDTRFTVVPTARGRWLVESFDIERLSDLCRPS